MLVANRCFVVFFLAAGWVSQIIVWCTAGEPLSPGQALGLSFAILLSWFLFNLLRSRILARFFLAFALFYIAFAVCVIVSLYSVSAPTSSLIDLMWSSWTNESGFMGADAYVALLSLPSGMMYAMTDYEVRAKSAHHCDARLPLVIILLASL